jgi:hypothetical protein
MNGTHFVGRQYEKSKAIHITIGGKSGRKRGLAAALKRGAKLGCGIFNVVLIFEHSQAGV